MISKIKKSLHILYIIDIILLLFLILVYLKTPESFRSDQGELILKWYNLRRILLISFLGCSIFSFVFYCFAKEVQEELIYLSNKISELEKKITK